MIKSPPLGFGLGLRVEHYETILADHPPVDWFEALTENYLVPGGKPLHNLMRIRERYPLVMHGVSMSIGSTAPLDRGYLAQVKALAARVEPQWISDHLCWTGVEGRNAHVMISPGKVIPPAKEKAEKPKAPSSPAAPSGAEPA